MEEISVKGIKYQKAKLVARELGYTNDYIGQLCRAGKVDAELVGRTWYVDPESVKGHKKTRYRSTKRATERQLKAEIQEIAKEQEALPPQHFYTHKIKTRTVSPAVGYEADEAELLPTPKKDRTTHERVKLDIELADAEKLSVKQEDEKKYHFTAPKREETKFFGTLKVTDFITEVPVADAEAEHPRKVEVKGKTRPVYRENPFTPKSVLLKELHKEAGVSAEPESPKSHVVAVHTARDVHVALPVSGEEEVVRLPIVYHIVTASALVFGFAVSAGLIGLQAIVTYENQQLLTEYIFTAENLSALLYLVK